MATPTSYIASYNYNILSQSTARAITPSMLVQYKIAPHPLLHACSSQMIL